MGASVGIEPTTFLLKAKQSTIDSQSEVIENLSLSPIIFIPRCIIYFKLTLMLCNSANKKGKTKTEKESDFGWLDASAVARSVNLNNSL